MEIDETFKEEAKRDDAFDVHNLECELDRCILTYGHDSIEAYEARYLLQLIGE